MLAIAPPEPCTKGTTRCADARDYNHELRECCRDHVVGMMQVLAPLLDSLKVRWWLDYGSLLGAVRNPLTTWADYPWLPQEDRTTEGPAAGIIPHDKDADLGVAWLDWSKVSRIRPALIRAGYSVTTNHTAGMMKIRLSKTNHTNVDLFFWHERADGSMYRTGYVRGIDEFKGREFQKSFLYPLSTVEFEGMQLPAPRNPEAFCAMRYGSNWQQPVCANSDGVRRGEGRA